MSSYSPTEEHAHHGGIVHHLEKGDGLAHVLVAILLLLLAAAILIISTVDFVSAWVHHPETNGFAAKGLDYLSNLLLGVIVLELLSTILTYIQARNLEATIKDFLVVALISSIRKILLVGAQSSLEKSSGDDFVKEATGTIISIVGILLLIGGLMMLDKRMKARREAELEPASPEH